jgi:hypothetical protein
MEEVEDDLSVWRFVIDGFDEGGGHIDGDYFEFGGAFGAEFVEEEVESVGVLTLGGAFGAEFVEEEVESVGVLTLGSLPSGPYPRKPRRCACVHDRRRW